MNIYVGNLPHTITETDLKSAFEEFGRTSSVKLIKDMATGELKGFGFVEMPSQTDALTAIQNLNGKDFKGRAIVVNEARPREDKKGPGPKREGGFRGGQGFGKRDGGHRNFNGNSGKRF